MDEKSKSKNSNNFKARSLEKYSNKDEVKKKWYSLSKRLVLNKANREYSSIVIEATSVLEFVMENTLKDDFVEGRFLDNVDRLIEKGCSISDSEFNKLKRIKWYRNMAAHNTETVVQEIINYESAKETFIAIGTLLSELNMLSKEDIFPDHEKLKADVGDVIGETCLLQELIGQGSSGKVFKAYHKRLDLIVAVKEINNGFIDSTNVVNEKNMLLSLHHNGIPRIYDIIEDNQTYYLVMDYIEGQTLKEYIEKMGKLPLKPVLRITKELCNILGYIHNFKDGIIFRDLKPSNIILDKETHVHLIDFGISKGADTKESNSPVYSGTIVYSSPEQLNGEECDNRSDIYSLGGVIYYMAEGRNPVENGEQSYTRSTPEALVKIIEKAMAGKKEERYLNVYDLEDDINNAQRLMEANPSSGRNGQTTYSMPQQQAVKKSVSKKPRNKLLIPAVIAVVFLILGSIFIYNMGRHNASENTNKQLTAANSTSSNSQANQSQGETSNTQSSQNGTAAQSANNGSSDGSIKVNASTAAFNGKAKLVVDSYKIDGSNLIVKGSIENNSSKEFTISPYDIYVMGDNKKKFSVDMPTYNFNTLNGKPGLQKIVPGEKRDFEITFNGYEDSQSLTLKTSHIYSMSSSSNDNFTLKIK